MQVIFCRYILNLAHLTIIWSTAFFFGRRIFFSYLFVLQAVHNGKLLNINLSVYWIFHLPNKKTTGPAQQQKDGFACVGAVCTGEEATLSDPCCSTVTSLLPNQTGVNRWGFLVSMHGFYPLRSPNQYFEDKQQAHINYVKHEKKTKNAATQRKYFPKGINKPNYYNAVSLSR